MGDPVDPNDEQQLPVERAVKFVGPDTIEGLAFPFDSPDTDAETFTKATDYCEDWFPAGRPLLYHHGLDPVHKAVKVGRQTEYEDREGGRWAQSQLEANAKYRKHIDALIERGALGYSSGAYPHLATKNARGQITRWPWVELSLTPIPAHPGTLGVHYVKSADFLDLFEEDVPPLVEAAIKALDDWASSDLIAGPGSGSLEEKAGRVTAAVAELHDHARAHHEMRTKTGRVLSAVNRERIATALASKEAVMAAYSDLEALLAETDPEAVTKSVSPAFPFDDRSVLVRAALVTSIEGVLA